MKLMESSEGCRLWTRSVKGVEKGLLDGIALGLGYGNGIVRTGTQFGMPSSS
jgi:hypothetical protein